MTINGFEKISKKDIRTIICLATTNGKYADNQFLQLGCTGPTVDSFMKFLAENNVKLYDEILDNTDTYDTPGSILEVLDMAFDICKNIYSEDYARDVINNTYSLYCGYNKAYGKKIITHIVEGMMHNDDYDEVYKIVSQHSSFVF